MRNRIVAFTAITMLYIIFGSYISHILLNTFSSQSNSSEEIEVDWEAMYPHSMSAEQTDVYIESSQNTIDDTLSNNTIEKYVQLCSHLTNTLENRFEQWIPFRIKIIEMNGWLVKQTGIKIIMGSDDVISLGDGYLTFYYEKNDTSKAAENMEDFYAWLSDKEIPFLYVQAPFKISKNFDETNIQGYNDFSNENANSFVSHIISHQIPTLDLRDSMPNSQVEYLKYFFKTDHHWQPKSGLWATTMIAQKLNQEYGYDINLYQLNIEQFYVDTYENWFLGSQGKKVTLGFTDAENLDIYYPKYETDFSINIPSLGIEKTGCFYDTLIDHSVLQEKNYYNEDAYSAYGYGNQALIRTHNNLITNGKTILIIKDSFANCVHPFLALELENIDVIDLRYFTGSIKTYIEKIKPDMVLCLYSPDALVSGNEKLFCFE